ncbi:FAD-binding protein, partial [Escherichia coli]|nr:FAD-binding protein [Escherichia coli]
RENEPLSKHTTMKIGGPADVLLEPSSVENLKIAMDIIRKHNVKWRAIGRGSNLLVSDKGIEGVVIKLGAGLDDLQIDGERVTVGGGYPSIKLATVITKQGLSGP